MNHLPPKIDDLGLPAWIDSNKSKQNGYGWADFDFFCSIHMPDTVLGRVFNKSNKTIKDWKHRRDKLLGNGDSFISWKDRVA